MCRVGGIGRRSRLKIEWGNPPCGFESHTRHHFLLKRRARRCSGLFGVRRNAWQILRAMPSAAGAIRWTHCDETAEQVSQPNGADEGEGGIQS